MTFSLSEVQLKLKNFPIVRICNWIIISIVCIANYNVKDWKNPEKIINWDVISYYAYLPASFIYHDLSLKFTDTASDEVRSRVWYEPGPNNSRVIKMTMGVSILYSPFFFAAHFISPYLGHESNGYTEPYRIALIFSSIFFFGCALYFLRKVLSEFFSQGIVALTIVTITLGTNLFHYVYTEPTMSHAYSFFLFSVFIFLTAKWYKHPKVASSILIGLTTGLIVLIRPTNIIILTIFLFWNILSFKEIKDRILFFVIQYKFLLIIFFCGALVWLPQIAYWKTITGNFFFYSYTNNEGFFFSSPEVAKTLFSFRKGWLLYTPVMIFSLLGIFFLKKEHRELFLPTLTFNILNIYIISAWWCWWYGGSFGQRPFIDAYPLQAFGLAAFICVILRKQGVFKVLTFLAFTFFVALNQFQIKQYRTGAIHWDAMSKKAYLGTFGKLTPPEDFQQLIDPPDYEAAKKGLSE